jgi:phosphoenolpyruvate carboxykinase (ATP)
METYGLERLGLTNCGPVYRNLPVARLVEMAVARGEGILTESGALRVTTGKYTGRSPNDKFTVDVPSVHSEIEWGKVNAPISPEKFDHLYDQVIGYLQNRPLFVQDCFAGADPEYSLKVRVVSEFAWQSLFAQQLFLRPTEEQLQTHTPEFTVIAAPNFHADPKRDGTNSEAFVLVNFERRIVLIGGTHYAGEIKKSIFTVMNYLMPHRSVMPMHCSANTDANGDVALFFGLSGTGKTTLSADPERSLIGDDEHGWSANGVFNFEGGCYAKCINLTEANEPQIFHAIKFGSVLENVVMCPESRKVDYSSDKLTENTRAAYPVDYIPNAVIPGVGGIPSTVVFLTADAFGVLPPISRLSPEQAMYHFLSGYTSKLAGTERGITEPQATFSTCFGAPFLPLPPTRYAEMLGKLIAEHKTRVFLVNTGWSGGPYGVGQRMKLRYTRAMVSAALKGELDQVAYAADPIFGLSVPQSCPNVPAEVLNPRDTWADKAAYDRTARDLAGRFQKNFTNFANVSPTIAAAGPKA